MRHNVGVPSQGRGRVERGEVLVMGVGGVGGSFGAVLW